MMQHMIAILVLLSTALQSYGLGVLPKKAGKCPTVPSCKCTDDSDKLGWVKISCQGTTSEDLNDITHVNMTELSITKSTLDNLTFLKVLKQNTVAPSACLLIHNTKVPIFTWAWLPEMLERVRLVGTETNDIFANVTTDEDKNKTEYRCSADHIQKLKILYLIEQHKLRTIPHCLPDATEWLVFMSASLEDLRQEEDIDGRREILWPKSLTLLNFVRNNITSISPRVFANSPRNLTKMFIKEQKIKDGRILRHLPASTLTELRLTVNDIKDIAREDFETFRRANLLNYLDLSNNNLTSIPNGMPSSIKTLSMSSNKVTIINNGALEDLHQLKELSLSRNLIQKVPAGLPASLETLDLRGNHIFSCNFHAFGHMKNLQSLDLSRNRLTTMPRNLPGSMKFYSLEGNQISGIGEPSHYQFCAECKSFTLGENPWSCDSHMVSFLLWAKRNDVRGFSINNSFQCASTVSADLDGLRLEYIIEYMGMVQKVGCSYNMTVLNCTGVGLKEYFPMMRSLQEVYISDNPSLGNVPDFKFADQKKMLRLELNRNGLTRIPYGLPRCIETLSLVGNNISIITEKDVKALRNLTNIKALSLDNNNLKTFMATYVEPLPTINIVSLRGNPLVCDCSIWPFTSWLTEKLSKSDIVTKSREYGKCTKPAAAHGKDISQLEGYYSYDLKCIPELCQLSHVNHLVNCSYVIEKKNSNKSFGKVNLTLGRLPDIRPSNIWKSIDATGMQLNSSAIQMKHLHGLKHVILSNNSFQKFPLHGFPVSILSLTLNHNNISELPTLDQLKQFLPNLEYIDLRNNNIRSVNEKNVRILPSMKGVLLHGNPLVCDCELLSLVAWISANKDNKRVIKSYKLEDLLCYGPKQLAGKSIIKLSHSEYCPDINISGIAAGLVAAVVIFTAASIFCNLYLHKKRKKRENEDILQGFRELLQHEAGYNDQDPETGVIYETDRFMYDAFVSYSPHEADSNFAMMLLDELEIRREYKLCVHERDFVPGIGIADNIVECISASKRIILILSKNFVSSPWCQYEVQVALTELHQKRRSKLLIPVLLEDISEEKQVAGGVKIFLSLIQGIRIPANKKESSWKEFWTKLSEAMPEVPIEQTKI